MSQEISAPHFPDHLLPHILGQGCRLLSKKLRDMYDDLTRGEAIVFLCKESLEVIKSYLSSKKDLNGLTFANKRSTLFVTEADPIDGVLDKFSLVSHSMIEKFHHRGPYMMPLMERLLGSLQLPNLQVLDLSNNYLRFTKKLGQILTTLPCLVDLNLSKNGIGPTSAADMAPYLGEMVKLRSLDLSDNKLTEVGIKFLSSAFSKLTHLHTLNLADNRIICVNIIDDTFEYLRELHNLRNFNVKRNYVTGLSKYLESFTGGLQSLQLCLISNDIGLAQGLERLTDLHTLDLENIVNIKYISAIAPSLMGLTSLHSLNLVGSCDEDLSTLIDALMVMTGLHTLGLSLCSNKSTFNIANLMPCLTRMTGLHTLDLSCNGFGPDGMASLSNLDRLQSLDLSRNNLGSEGIASLVPTLFKMTKLHSLRLSGNKLRQEGAASLAPVLSYLTGLHTLHLSDNGMQNEGLSYLVPSLVVLTGLHTLDLSLNDIINEGYALLDPVFAALKNLRHLDISHSDCQQSVPVRSDVYWKGNDYRDIIDLSRCMAKEDEVDDYYCDYNSDYGDDEL